MEPLPATSLLSLRGLLYVRVDSVQNGNQVHATREHMHVDVYDKPTNVNGGGKVIAPPFDVGDQGRMATFQDPSGAFISAWQPKAMNAAFPSGEAGQFGWGELNARGVDKALPFYQKAPSFDKDLSGKYLIRVGQRNVGWIERTILRRARNVDDSDIVLNDPDEVTIRLGRVGLLDLSLEPVCAFKGMLRE